MFITSFQAGELDITAVAPIKMAVQWLWDALRPLRSRLIDQLFRFLHINGVHLLLWHTTCNIPPEMWHESPKWTTRTRHENIHSTHTGEKHLDKKKLYSISRDQLLQNLPLDNTQFLCICIGDIAFLGNKRQMNSTSDQMRSPLWWETLGNNATTCKLSHSKSLLHSKPSHNGSGIWTETHFRVGSRSFSWPQSGQFIQIHPNSPYRVSYVAATANMALKTAISQSIQRYSKYCDILWYCFWFLAE